MIIVWTGITDYSQKVQLQYTFGRQIVFKNG